MGAHHPHHAGRGAPAERLTIAGSAHNLLGTAGVVPVIMKIDKCSGAVLEMSFDKDKLTAGGAATDKAAPPPAAKPAPLPAAKPVTANKPPPVAASKAADKQVASKPVAEKAPIPKAPVAKAPVPKAPVHKTVKENASGDPSANDMADQMIRMFGREAEGQARENAASHARAGDSDGEKLWLSVADIISDRTYGHGRAGGR